MSLVYCLFVYLITIGLFNVISAIFVEATMKSAAEMAHRTKQERLQNDDLWSVQVSTLLQRLVRRHIPEPLHLFSYSWYEHCNVPLEEKVADARAENLQDVPNDKDWNDRLLVTGRDGNSAKLSLSNPSEDVFPITVKLQAPKSFRDVEELDSTDEVDDTVDEKPLSEEFREISRLAYAGKTIDKWAKDPYVVEALNELDIDPHDHAILSDILDPQNDGQVPVLDLIDGIRRLRGFPRRSDIVAIDLMIRQSQRLHHQHDQDIDKVQSGVQRLQTDMETLMGYMGNLVELKRSKSKSIHRHHSNHSNGVAEPYPQPHCYDSQRPPSHAEPPKGIPAEPPPGLPPGPPPGLPPGPPPGPGPSSQPH